MVVKHGLSQGRINRAKDYARMMADRMVQIDLMFRASVEGVIDEEKANNFITANIKEYDRDLEYFKSYIEQRDDEH
jgi:hypothetical protein